MITATESATRSMSRSQSGALISRDTDGALPARSTENTPRLALVTETRTASGAYEVKGSRPSRRAT